MAGPQFRAAMCRMTLNRVRSQHDAAEVLGRVPAASVETIDRAQSLAWIPAEPLNEINTAMLDARGADGYLDFWSELSAVASTSPLLGALAGAAMRIFGPGNPRGLLKWISRAGQLTSRNMGTITTEERADNDMLVVQRDIPLGYRLDCITLCLHGSILGIVRSTQNTPRVDADMSRYQSDGFAAYRVRW